MSVADSELEAYLDEALSAERMSALEDALRGDAALRRRLAAINSRRDAGVHSIGEIWRRHRLTCPERDQWGAYLLEALSDEAANYLEFHLRVVGCRYCQANLQDLAERQQAAEVPEEVATRRRKYFQSSASYLRTRSY